MLQSFTNQTLAAADAHRAGRGLMDLAWQLIPPESVDDPNARLQAAEQVAGRDVCRRLGLYETPDDFLLSVIIPVYNEAETIA